MYRMVIITSRPRRPNAASAMSSYLHIPSTAVSVSYTHLTLPTTPYV